MEPTDTISFAIEGLRLGWWEGNPGLPCEPRSMAIGVFDGVHRGHQELLHRVAEFCKTHATRPSAYTFRIAPIHRRGGKHYLGNVDSFRRKLERLHTQGVEDVCLVDFSPRFSDLAPERFLNSLVDRLGVSHLVVGDDFRLGRERAWGREELARYAGERGVRVDIASSVLHNGEPVSSTRVREAVQRGDFSLAEKLLGRPFEVDLRDMVPHAQNGVLEYDGSQSVQVLPPSGHYGVELVRDREIVPGELSVRDLVLSLAFRGTANFDFIRFSI
jgi:riboflavin kinase/FMN adenylyltransferase